jgi:hypothetical protein
MKMIYVIRSVRVEDNTWARMVRMVNYFKEYEPEREIQLVKNINGFQDTYHFVMEHTSLEEFATKNTKNPGADVAQAWQDAFARREGEGDFRDQQENFYHVLDTGT